MVWLTNWDYRKTVTISNTGSTLSDYQTSITVDTATLISAGKMRSDCGDIRLTDDDGSTLLPYWIESGQNTVSTKIWIKSTLANGNNTVYMYYGNPSVASASDGNTTFHLYDHFLGTSYDTSKWTVGGIGNVDVASSVASIYSTVDDGLKYLASSLTFGIGYAIYFYGYMTFHNSGSEVHVGFNSERDATGVGFLGSGSYWTKIQKFTKPPEILIDYQMTRDNSYHTWKVVRKSTTSNLYQIDTIAVEELTTSIPTDNETVMIRTRKGNDKFFVDYVFVTKYTSPEPTFSISITEEMLGAPVCPIALKYEGNTVHLSAIPKDGIGPYTVIFKKNNTPISSLSNVVENMEVIYDYILTNEDIRIASLGTINFSVYIEDSCPTTHQTCEQICTINIGCVAPICNFIVT